MSERFTEGATASSMFERFTAGARQVVVLAQDEARALMHDHIASEHILAGLVREQDGIAAHALADLDVTAERIREQIVATVGRGASDASELEFTPHAKRLLELALREALALGHNYVGTEHVLLAVLREEDAVAARILCGLADPQAVRAQVFRKLTGGLQATPAIGLPGPASRAAGAAPHGDFPELGGLSDGELDELIDRLAEQASRLLHRHGALQGKLEILRAQRNHRRMRGGAC